MATTEASDPLVFRCPVNGAKSANNKQPAPTLLGKPTPDLSNPFLIVISGTVPDHATKLTLEFFASDPSGFGQGKFFLGAITLEPHEGVMTPFEARVLYYTPFPLPMPTLGSPGPFITATATDELGNTSPFSNVVSL